MEKSELEKREQSELEFKKAMQQRWGGLRRFAFAITVFNIFGHLYLGFEQSYAQPLVALATAYGLEILLELISAKTEDRPYRFSGGFTKFVDFLLSAHITALAVSMLTYANSRLLVVAFATAVAIASKTLLKVTIGKGKRHFYNPSNFGITVTLLLFPWVGIAQPYQFTENLDAYGDWLLPAFIICSGSLLNAVYTKRLPLIVAWLSGFALQAVARNLLFDTQLTAAFLPMTGVAFILYTFYMVTDPGTTPRSWYGQIFFGFGNALVYGILMGLHIVFGLFFALTIVCTIRGGIIYANALLANRENIDVFIRSKAAMATPSITSVQK